jgi:hypothetical protein
MLLADGGGAINHVPITAPGNEGTPLSEAPYMSAIPQPSPNVMALPLTVGAEFLSTEYESGNYEYNQALTSNTNTSTGTPAGTDVGKIRPREPGEICIGFVSRKPGTPRHYGDPVPGSAFYPGTMDAPIQAPNPNPMVSVTGKNLPGLCFWGCPFPAKALD